MDAGPALPERRSWPRRPVELYAECIRLAGTEADLWPARATDLSRGGVALEAVRPFDAGAGLSVRFRSRDGRSSLALPVHVVRTPGAAPGGFAAGCRFSAELSDEVLNLVRGCG
jgi:PilZ domain